MNNFHALPKAACEGELKNYGFYRLWDDGSIEFISVCNPLADELLSVYNGELDELLQQ
jgi:hypothetical protein